MLLPHSLRLASGEWKLIYFKIDSNKECSLFHRLDSLKKRLKNLHIVSTRGFVLISIKLALFLFQNIIFWVVFQHDWRGSWHKEPLGQSASNITPTYPYQHPSLAPTHHTCGPQSSCVTCTDRAHSAGSSRGLEQHSGMFLEVARIIDPCFNEG